MKEYTKPRLEIVKLDKSVVDFVNIMLMEDAGINAVSISIQGSECFIEDSQKYSVNRA